MRDTRDNEGDRMTQDSAGVWKSKMPPKAAGRPDDFQTPAYGWRYVAPFIPKSWGLWESAAGKGSGVRTFREDGFDIFGSDIIEGYNFLDPLLAPSLKFDMTVTNPPYSIKDKWLKRCFEIGKPFALLLPITALGEQKRVAMYRQHGIQLVMPPRRIMFTSPNGTEGKTWFYTAWFCHGLNLPAEINYANDSNPPEGV